MKYTHVMLKPAAKFVRHPLIVILGIMFLRYSFVAHYSIKITKQNPVRTKSMFREDVSGALIKP